MNYVLLGLEHNHPLHNVPAKLYSTTEDLWDFLYLRMKIAHTITKMWNLSYLSLSQGRGVEVVAVWSHY